MSDEWVMEPRGPNRQDGEYMSDPSALRRPRMAALLLLVAGAAVAGYALTKAPHAKELAGQGLVFVTSLIGCAAIMETRKREGAWRTAPYLATAIALLALASAALFALDLREQPVRSGLFDLLFLLFLMPILGAAAMVHVAQGNRVTRGG